MARQLPSVSIIVPCYNEAGNIRGAVECIKDALSSSGAFSSCEILIFNDFSTDDTGRIAEEIKAHEPGVRVIHNPKNMGFGYNYTEGVRQAKKDYIIMVPGDNEIPAEAIRRVLCRAGEADVIIPYTANPEVRPLSRRVISRAFVALINTLFGLSLRYYNGTCLIKSSLLKKVPLKTWGFAYMAAILVRLLRSGASYEEVGIEIVQRQSGRTKAFAFKNIISVVKAILTLFWDVRVKERSKYCSRPVRASAKAVN
ncbi:MAG TPA: glycosyltransferase family 2 protein [Thermodesulfobacteriota bacterium]